MMPTKLLAQRVPNPIYFRDTFYRIALVSAICLTAIAALVAATQCPLGSPSFVGMTVGAGAGFIVSVILIMKGSYHSQREQGPAITHAVIVDEAY